MPGASYKAKNRKVRQENVREEIAARCKVTKVLELADKIEDATDSLDVQKYKAAADIRLKLIAKYIPDLKSVEMGLDAETISTLRAIESTMAPSDATMAYRESLKASVRTH